MLTKDELKPLQDIANKKQVGILTFVAQEKIKRVNPATYARTSITTSEEYQLEKIIDKECGGIDNIYLLLHSPGGNLASSYKIALFLRERFKKIVGFIPYSAASGATLMSFGCNEIVLGDLGYLTPIDPQIPYRGQYVSSYSIIEMVERLEDRFSKLTPEEMPIPWRQMADKIDIINYRDMEAVNWEATIYARKLLTKSGYDEKVADKIARAFSRTPFSHEHCFCKEDCSKHDLKVSQDKDYLGYLSTFKGIIHLINKKDTEETLTHVIEVVVPEEKDAIEDKKAKEKLDLPS